jgi:predicted DCC family thiol-disulfide oxidoreductase YuxK
LRERRNPCTPEPVQPAWLAVMKPTRSSGSDQRWGTLRSFCAADLRSLALLRVVLGALLVVDLWGRLGLVETLYSNDGVLTNHYSLFRPLAPYQFSWYVALSSTRDVKVAMVLTLMIYIAFAAGYRTRLFHLLSFVCVTSLHSRNLMTELPSDIPLHLWVGWSLFLPLGNRFSIDSLRRSLKEPREASVAELNAHSGGVPSIMSIAVAGMLLQLSAMHIVAALRQAGPAWQDGSALYYALHQSLWVTDWGTWIGRHAPVEYLRTVSFAYRALEVLIGVLVLVPTFHVRRIALALLIAFHLVSRALWNFGPYEWVMLGSAPLLISSRDWQALQRWYVTRKPRLTVYFDADSGLCFAFCRLLKRLDVLSLLSFAATNTETPTTDMEAATTEMIVVRDESRATTFRRASAIAALFRSLPLGRPVGVVLRIPGIASLADWAYGVVERHRAEIATWFGFNGLRQGEKLPAIALDDSIRLWMLRVLRLSREGAALILLLVCGVALARDMSDESEPTGLDGVIYRIVAYPRLFQRWGLFAPEPPKRPGMLVAEAQTTSGTKLDPLTGRPQHHDGTVDGARERPNPLMQSYFTSISQPSRSTYVNELREYVRRIGDRRGPGDKLVWFNVDWIEAPISAPDGYDSPAELAAVTLPRRITSGP